MLRHRPFLSRRPTITTPSLSRRPARARDLGLACGSLPPGPRNSIADIPGVTVGHATLVHGDIRTAVTPLRPPPADVFPDRPLAPPALPTPSATTPPLLHAAD